MLAAGSLNKRIQLLSPATTQDVAGGPGPMVAGPPIWASIDTPFGQNVFQGSFVSEATHLVKIRYQKGITPNMKILFGTRTFNITYIGNPQERNEALWLFSQEIQ